MEAAKFPAIARELDFEIEYYREFKEKLVEGLLDDVCTALIGYANEVADTECSAEEFARILTKEIRHAEDVLCAEVNGAPEKSTATDIGEFSERFQAALDEAIDDFAEYHFFTARRDGVLVFSIEENE